MKISVIGSGRMGIGIAEVFAAANNEVVFYGRSNDSVEKSFNGMIKVLDKSIAKGRIDETHKVSLISKIKKTTNINDISDSDLVIEAVIEDIKIKKTIFKQLCDLCKPDAILATNTSSLSVTEIAASTKRSDKVIGMHFFNPAPVMKLIEVIRAITTSDDTFTKIKNISISIGKDPIEIHEAPGFVVNRILIPMINEAIGILADGVASAHDIDKAMKLGANHPMGPLELADFIGNDVNLEIMECLFNETCDSKYRPHPLLKKMVRAGYLGRKTKKGFYQY